VLHTAGKVKLGRVSLRGMTTRIEIGAQARGRLTIGERVFINQGSTIVAATEIAIGDDCRIGDYTTIYDTEYHPVESTASVRSAPVRIGRNVWIARGVTVLPGVTIGDHAVIAANALVTHDVPDRTLVAGVPARPIRKLEAPDDWRRP
jgi:acetyltransferase-like isoleucine patch superfamily enzyme